MLSSRSLTGIAEKSLLTPASSRLPEFREAVFAWSLAGIHQYNYLKQVGRGEVDRTMSKLA